MRTAVTVGIMGCIILIAFSCTGKKMSETDYFSKANQYMEQQNWGGAETHFLKGYENYPDGLFSEKSLFMIGYLNANHLNNFDKARKYYQLFIEKYPDHELVTAARYELDNLGKPPDELPFTNEQDGVGAINTDQTKSKQKAN